MATNDQVTRTSGYYAFGNVVAAGLVSAAVSVGGIFLGGNIHFDTTQNTNPAIRTATSAVLQSYDGQTATVSTTSGGRVNYTAMSWTNPNTTGSQSLLQFRVDIAKAPVGSNDISCAIGPPNFTNSGSTFGGQSVTFLLKHKGFGTGSSLTASGNALPLVIPPGWGGRCWYLVAPGATIKAKARVLTGDQYVP